jgi:hypothetical protein
MNHAALVADEALRHYRNRSYIGGLLDRGFFLALNPGAHVCGLDGYCLDATEYIPAGGMHDAARMPTQTTMPRGYSLADVQRLERIADELIAEILAEHPAA